MKKTPFHNFIFSLSIIYLSLPWFIFFIGWIKLWIGCPISIVFALILFKVIKKHSNKDYREIYEQPGFSKLKVTLTLIIIFMWVALSGQGVLFYQNTDYAWRNALLRDLINSDWPTRLGFDDGSLAYSVYYIGYFMLPALVGKIFGWIGANIMSFILSWVGAVLFTYWISYILKRCSLVIPVVFIFFSGLDILIGKYQGITYHYEWVTPWQYSSITTTLFWVFNQAIPTWIVLGLLLYSDLYENSIENIIFYIALLTFYAPFPCIGLAPFVIYILIKHKKNIKNVFTIQNTILSFVLVFTIFVYYLPMLLNGKNTITNGTSIISNFSIKYLTYLVIFCIIEFGYYFIIIYFNSIRKKDNKLGIYFYISTFTLIILPFFKGNDLIMRASIPAILIYMILVTQAFLNKIKNRSKVILLILFTIGAFTPFTELVRGYAFREKVNDYYSFLKLEKTQYNFFDYKLSNNYFYRYIAKDSKPLTIDDYKVAK
jgi:hypothetical protein